MSNLRSRRRSRSGMAAITPSTAFSATRPSTAASCVGIPREHASTVRDRRGRLALAGQCRPEARWRALRRVDGGGSFRPNPLRPKLGTTPSKHRNDARSKPHRPNEREKSDERQVAARYAPEAPQQVARACPKREGGTRQPNQNCDSERHAACSFASFVMPPSFAARTALACARA